MPKSRLQSIERLEGFLISRPSGVAWEPPLQGFASRQARAGWPDGVMMAGLLWGCSSEAPCTDTSRSAVWIPLSDSLHHRSCHHCNQKSDMPTLVMDGLRPLRRRRHRKLTHVHPGMKTWHLRALRVLGVSSPGSCAVSRKWRADWPPFLAPFLKRLDEASRQTGLSVVCSEITHKQAGRVTTVPSQRLSSNITCKTNPNDLVFQSRAL